MTELILRVKCLTLSSLQTHGCMRGGGRHNSRFLRGLSAGGQGQTLRNFD